MPAECAEIVLVAEVAGLVAFDLLFPEGPAGFWKAELRAILMSVPEAAVDEDHRAVFWQDKVGSAGQRLVFRTVDGEAIAEAVEYRAHGQLRFRVASPDAGHDLGALFRSEDVGHGQTNNRTASNTIAKSDRELQCGLLRCM